MQNNRAELFQKSLQKNINCNKNCNKQHERLIEELYFLNLTGMIIHLLDFNIFNPGDLPLKQFILGNRHSLLSILHQVLFNIV